MGVVSAKELEIIKSKQVREKGESQAPLIPITDAEPIRQKRYVLWHPDRSERSNFNISYAVLDTFAILVDGVCTVYNEDVKNQLVKDGFKIMKEEY